MSELLLKLAAEMVHRLLTATTVDKFAVLILRGIAEKTPTKIDDKAVDIIAIGLGVIESSEGKR